MKYSRKVFLTMSLVIMIGFSVFGNFLLFSFFQNELSRTYDQGSKELEWFEYIFTISFVGNQDTTENAVIQSMSKIKENLKEKDNIYFLYKDGFVYEEFKFSEEKNKSSVSEMIENMVNSYSDSASEVVANKKMKTEKDVFHYSIHLSRCIINGETYFLGFCKDITDIYVSRNAMLKNYRVAMLCMLLVCACIIYFITRFLTKPIEKLTKNAMAVSKGNYQVRSNIRSKDEIGLLSKSIDQMTDQLVEHMDQLQSEMERKALEAKQKEDFIAAFSHELKTPLTSIIGYADMLSTVEMNEEEKSEAYFYIYHQGKRLQNLSFKLMELISVEHQNTSFTRIQMSELEDELLKIMKFRWEDGKKEIKALVTLSEGIIMGDRDLLLSLFTNCLDNATKAIEKNGFIFMSGEQSDAGYEIKIVDNGCGIPEDEIERITEPFYMVDKSRSRKEGGAGIGLALSQRIIKLHDAELSIKSKLSEGTIVKIVFPLAIEEQTDEEGVEG